MEKWRQAVVGVEDIVPAEMNANRMSEEDFGRLVENIRMSGGLSSAIACYRRTEDGKYVIISGHHRFEACLRLAYRSVPVIYADEADMSRDEIIALQLSHNSLHGEDNRGILKRMFDEIRSVDFKEFAHVDVSEIGDIDIFSGSLVPLSEHYVVTFILYRNDIRLLDELLGNISENIGKSEFVILADGDGNEEIMMALNREIGKKYNIKSANICFAKMLALAKKAMDDDLGGDDGR